SVVPLTLGMTTWRNLDYYEGPRLDDATLFKAWRRNIVIVSLAPGDPAFKDPQDDGVDVRGQLELLRVPDAVVLDDKSRDQFRRPEKPSTPIELGAHQVRIIGHCPLGTGFSADGLVLTSEETFATIFGPLFDGRVSLGLIKLAPGDDAEQIAQELNRRL